MYKDVRAKLSTSVLLFFLLFSTLSAENLSVASEQGEEKTDFLKIGGAVRFNYEYKSYESNSSALKFELFRIKVEGELSGVEYYAQYRWYEDFSFPEYAYAAYDLAPTSRIEFGLHRVPFGLQPFSSHGYWESLVYHIGLEDDNDLGAKYIYKNDELEFKVAYYQNAELSNDQPERFSFDLVTRPDDPNTAEFNEREANYERSQWNLWAERDLGKLQLGASLQYGDIFNEDTGRTGSQRMFALHANYDRNDWNYQVELGSYDYDVENAPGIDSDQVLFGAFGARFGVASEADFVLINVQKKIDMSAVSYIDEMTCYDNWGIVMPKRRTASVGNDTVQNLLGCSIKKGPVLIFSELISGNNSVFANGPGVGLNGSTKIDHRININVGIYF